MRNINLSENIRFALLQRSLLLAMLLSIAGCGTGRREFLSPNGSGLVEASGAHQVQGSIQNDVVIGRPLASASQENKAAEISVRSEFGPLETGGKSK